MALYLGGSEKLKVIIDGVTYDLNISLTLPFISNIKLLSSDGYILQDVNGLYLMSKNEE